MTSSDGNQSVAPVLSVLRFSFPLQWLYRIILNTFRMNYGFIAPQGHFRSVGGHGDVGFWAVLKSTTRHDDDDIVMLFEELDDRLCHSLGF